MTVLSFVFFRWSLFLFENFLTIIPLLLSDIPKKSHFPWRLLGFAFIFILSLVGFSYLSNWAIGEGDTTVITLLSCVTYIYYLILFLGMILSIFQGNVYDLFSNFAKCYTIRQLAFCLYILLVQLIDPNLNFLDKDHIGWMSGTFYVFVFALVYGLAFLLIKKGVITLYKTHLDKPLFAFYIIVLLANTIINAVCENFSRDYRLMYILVMFSQLLSLVLIVALDFLIQRSKELQVQNYLVNDMLKKQEWQYRYAKTNMEQLRIRAHDLKHQVRILRKGGKEAEDLLKSLEDDIGDYEGILYTDNQVLNIILQEKWYFCRKHDIKLTTIVNPNAFQGVKNTDLYTMIGNILDNAIEAVLKITDKEKRVISVEVNYKNTLSTFRCDNYFLGELRFKNGSLETSKEDKESHGLGLKSIETIAKKYDGQMELSHDGEIFTLLVTIPDD